MFVKKNTKTCKNSKKYYNNTQLLFYFRIMENNKITQIVHDFFEKLTIEIDSLEVIQEEENIFYVKIQTPDSSLLI